MQHPDFAAGTPDLISRAVALATDWSLVSIAMSAYHIANGDVAIFQELLTIGAVDDIFWINLGALALFVGLAEGLYGTSPGKWLAGMRVRSVFGGEPGFLQGLFRNALRCADMFPVGIGFPGLVGLVAALLNPRRQRIGDIMASTIVRRHAPLSGRSHTVFTGVTVRDGATGQTLSDAEETEVEFRDLSRAEIESYVASGEPLDKAGGYGVQSGLLVKQIRGSLSNVAGLPMEMLQEMLDGLDG